MYNDTYYTNQYIAQVGGVNLPNINELERYFMLMIDWSLYISPEEYAFYEQSLQSYQQSEMVDMEAVLGNKTPATIASPSM